MRITFTDELKQFLVNKGTDLKYGARPLRRTVQRYIENPLAEQILKGSLDKGDDIVADVAKDEDGDECAEFKVIGKFEVDEKAVAEAAAKVAAEAKQITPKPKKKSESDPTEQG